MDKLIKLFQGSKTYAAVAITAVVVAALYFTGAESETLVAVGLAGLLGGTAGLRDAINKAPKTSTTDLLDKAVDAVDGDE